jgi:hypothetical protein
VLAEAGNTSRPKKSVAVPQRQLRVALPRQAAPPDIDGEQQIALSLPGGPFGSWRVAHARQRSRHDGEPGQGALDHINLQRAISQRHERLDRLEPGRQHGALALVEVSHSLGTRRLG